MKKTFFNSLFYSLLAAVFFVAVLINHQFLKGFSLDLSEDQVYSLSQGSKNILKKIDEPIKLYFFFSETSSKGMTAIRDYASRVETLLRQYEGLSNGNIRLEVIDPLPFSEAEDRAASFGLTEVGQGMSSNSIYFGLAGTNSLDDAMMIQFFDPQKESFLEYDISKLLYQLSEPEPINLTLLTDLPLAGGKNPLTGQSTAATVLYQQLEQFFSVTQLGSTEAALPKETDVLVILHPQSLSKQLLNSIDQFFMRDGKGLVFVDPHYESGLAASRGARGANSSSLSLLAHYGIKVDTAKVVLDGLTGLEVSDTQGNVIRHLGFLGLSKDNINSKDVASADLDTINGASFGSIGAATTNQLSITPLLQSSQNTTLVNANTYATALDPSELGKIFLNSQTNHILAARIKGRASSFVNQQDATYIPNYVDKTNNLNLVVVADADIVADRFWVQQSQFFGETVFSPFANNADLIINILENLGGSEGLIGIRSRGTFLRPFTRVQAIQALAEEKFRKQEQLLQVQLEQTDQKLLQLQNQSDNLSLSNAQQQAIDDFTKQKISIRKSLRDVQFQLDKDINTLGNQLKIINIVIAPLVLVLLLFILFRLFRKTAKHKASD